MTEEEAKQRNRRGRPSMGMFYEDKYPMAEKLEAMSEPIPIGGCIIWTGALNDSGYGRVKVRGKFRRTHRVAWEIANGSIPTGRVIDHLCSNRCCINSAHMELVDQAENCRRGNQKRYAR